MTFVSFFLGTSILNIITICNILICKFYKLYDTCQLESHNTTVNDKIPRSQYQSIITTSACDDPSPISVTFESAGSNYYRSNFNMGEFTSQPQPVLSCYGSHAPYLGTDYGSMSPSAFGETCKLIGSKPAIPTLLPSEIGSSYEEQVHHPNLYLHQNERKRQETSSSMNEAIGYMRTSSIPVSQMDYRCINVSSSSQIYPTPIQQQIFKTNSVTPKSPNASLPSLPSLIRSPVSVATGFHVSPSRYSNCLSEGTKLRSKTVSKTEIANSRNTFRPIER